jgi:hypothetical protein
VKANKNQFYVVSRILHPGGSSLAINPTNCVFASDLLPSRCPAQPTVISSYEGRRLRRFLSIVCMVLL